MRAFAALAIASCAAPSAPTHAPPSVPIEAHARAKLVDPALLEMSHLRELDVRGDVTRVTLDRASLVKKLEAHVAREIPREEIRREETFLKALGALPPEVDYERAVYDAIRASAGGMYEPFDHTMYLPDDLADASLATSIAHESVHALQDQHFDLRAFERYLPGQTDTMLARSCLAEGDATEATGEEPSLEPETYVERELAAPYVFGTAFVRALRRKGGWAEVDRAWVRPSLTTAEVLHPEKWFAAANVVAIPAPTFAALGSAFRDATVDVDVKGELSLRLVLASAMPDARAAEGAKGWAGDSSVSVRDGKSEALAWRIRYEDDASAARGHAIIADAFTQGRACSDERRAPVSVTRAEHDVLVLVGPPGARCDLVARWSREVLR